MAEVFGLAASALAVAELSTKVITLCLQYSRSVKHARDDIERVNKDVAHLKIVIGELRDLLEGPHGSRLHTTQNLRDALDGSRVQLRSLHNKLAPVKKRQAMKYLKWPFEREETEKTLQDLARYIQTINASMQIDQTNTLFEIDQKLVLQKLPVAAGAAFDSHADEHSPTCLPNTRVHLLREIDEWIGNPAAKAVFWLNGMAGTGKSTISRTLAQSCSECGQLGASFFFKRGEGDRGGVSKFFTTIIAQLVQQDPALAPHVKKAIDNDPGIFEKALQKQFEKLILQPLSKTCVYDGKAKALVIVVDALDECDRDEDIKLIIYLLSQVHLLPQLRIFLTSRPELPIRLGFHDVQGRYQDLILHEIGQFIIEHDLSIYFTHELTKIRIEYNNSVPRHRQLPASWPGPSNLEVLIAMAIPLFIFAATTRRFLADRRMGTPDANLQEILAHENLSQEHKLDATYLPVLNQLISGLSETRKKGVLTRFKQIVGSIVLLASPLSTPALANLLDMSQDKIDSQLDLLHSVLSISSSPNVPVRLLHLSFRDFLVDSLECDKNPFWVDEKATHGRLAADCLRIMDETLLADICGVQRPGTLYTSFCQRLISEKLPPQVQYACRYWVHHAQQGGDCLLDGGQVHRFLQKHFLHWLEALSLIGRASESVQNIRILQSLCQSEGCHQLSHFIDDALRFTLVNVSIIKGAPLQIYCSALTFAPEESIIRSVFQTHIPDWISLKPSVDTYWSNRLQTLEGHKGAVTSVAFSPDSKLVASSSWDKTVRLWSAVTGALQQTLKGHDHMVTSVAFSPDGGIVASASWDKTIRLWSAVTGMLLQTIEGHDGIVTSVAFSPNGETLASASWDRTVRLWSTATGKLQKILKDHDGIVTSVMFSPDGTLVASASSDKTVRLWLAATGTLKQVFEGHSGAVESLAFSPDGKLVASASQDETVQLWFVTTGALKQTLKGHSRGVESISFSPDGKLIASASHSQTIRLWSADTGELQQTFEGHSGWVRSVAFSSDGKMVASASWDETVQLWSAGMGTGALYHTPEGHSQPVKVMDFAPGGRMMASISWDKTVRLWSAVTGACLRSIDIGVASGRFCFDLNGRFLHTDVGAIPLDDLVQPTSIAHPDTENSATSVSSTTSGYENRWPGCMISEDNCWITLHNENLLFLPVEYRPHCWTNYGSTIAIATSSGTVVIIRVSAKAPAGPCESV